MKYIFVQIPLLWRAPNFRKSINTSKSKIERATVARTCFLIIAIPSVLDMSLLSCPLCLKPHFQCVDSLRTSLISVATTHISCPVCNELLLGLDKLTIHLFSHISHATPSSEVSRPVQEIAMDQGAVYKCNICDFCFSDQTILDLHQQLLHQTAEKRKGKYNYFCHLCPKQFKMRGSLMVHLRVAHFSFVQNNYKNRLVADAGEAETVDKRKGLPDKHWECDVCLKLFTTKYFLKKHKRLHTGEMPYYCAQCNKYFTFQQSYHKHMLYHSDNKPHVCLECGRAFKELSTLHNHERIHSGERPFTCETCGKSFRQRVSYLVHCRIHTGAMPYTCTACNKSFRYKISQRSHKCTADPPGNIVRKPDLVEKLKQNQMSSAISNASNLPRTPTQDSIEEILNYPPSTQTTSETYTLSLSPILSDVEALCLSNYDDINAERDNVEINSQLETINEESFKELLYGSQSNTSQ
ncbi:zinc finger protein 271-like isoform X2 [Photinus pyralis]|uniref:zinc finger protein 271-like isoform X2 n=1 Tax=Photinus pyralis TaxID=7054 RepID=UPI0012673DFB|nr:zinc finger protein 271-like isoform X2 [Photinus pyralis]